MKLPDLTGLVGWKFYAGIGLAAVLAVFLLVRCSDRAQDKAISTAHDAGRLEQSNQDLSETINRVKEAKDARDEIRGDDRARYDECVRSAGATAENCQRFVPDR